MGYKIKLFFFITIILALNALLIGFGMQYKVFSSFCEVQQANFTSKTTCYSTETNGTFNVWHFDLFKGVKNGQFSDVFRADGLG